MGGTLFFHHNDLCQLEQTFLVALYYDLSYYYTSYMVVYILLLMAFLDFASVASAASAASVASAVGAFPVSESP